MNKVIVSVINDLSTDQRVAKTCSTLSRMGFDVLLVGRELKSSKALVNRAYQTERMNLLFTKGPFFYLEFNLRLLILLLSKKPKLLVSNDLDTLLANFLASKIKNIPIVYDSHEYFTEVPELKGRFAKKAWLAIERWIFPKLTDVITVNESIAKIYGDIYGKKIHVVRNLPEFNNMNFNSKTKAELGIPENFGVVILQGSGINLDRGGEEAVLAMQFVENAVLLVVGGGDAIPRLKLIVEEKKIEGKVKFFPRMPLTELYTYTRLADIGLSLDKATNLNYLYSLPNKLFDYINCGVPVLASRMVEVAKIVENYDLGVVIDDVKPEIIAEKIRLMLHEDFKVSKQENLLEASRIFNWNEEVLILESIYLKYLSS